MMRARHLTFSLLAAFIIAFGSLPAIAKSSTPPFKAADAQSQSVTITQIFNLPASVFYDYDLNGNLTSDGAREYEYDDVDRCRGQTIVLTWSGPTFCFVLPQRCSFTAALFLVPKCNRQPERCPKLL